MPLDLSDKIDHKVLRKSEGLLSKPINEENVIVDHININSIRNIVHELEPKKVGVWLRRVDKT